MKRILYLLCSILLLSGGLYAQAQNILLTGGLSAQAQKKPADQGKAIRDKIRAEKRTFLMRELSLTAGEVDALMPVRSYYPRCRKLLPADKLVRLPMVCKDFVRRFFERHKR